MKPTWLRNFGKYFFWPVMWGLLLRIRLYGKQRVPPTGPLIVAANHVNFMDPLVLESQIGRLMVLFAKAEVMGWPFVGWLARHFLVIPVQRGEADPDAFKAALRALKQGAALYVAPEGTRNRDGRLRPGKPGAVVMALRTGAPVLPVGIWGQREFGQNWKQLRKTTVHVHFGRPFRFVGPTKPTPPQLQAMTDEMMFRIAALLPAEWRGVYSDPPPAWRHTCLLNEVTPATNQKEALIAHS